MGSIMYYDPFQLGLGVRGRSGAEFYVLCPYHSDSHHSASFNAAKGLFVCYACGAKKDAATLAEDLGGEVVEASPKDIHYIKHFGRDMDWRKYLGLPLANDNEYLHSRSVKENLVSAFNIRGNENLIIFPFGSEDHVIGCQTRSTHGKQYRFWGKSERVWPRILLPDEKVFFVEGVFGALRGLGAGVQALSIMGAGSAGNVAHTLGKAYLNSYMMLDDDPAGRIGSARALAHGVPFAKICDLEPDELTEGQWRYIANNTKEFFSFSLGELCDRTTNKEARILRRAYHDERRKV